MKFLITAKYQPVEYNGAAIIFGTGKPVFINVNDELFHEEYIQGKYSYRTGLSENHIKSNYFLNENEKKIFLEKQKKLLSTITSKFGKEAIKADNMTFWNSKRTVLRINTDTLQTIYDTDDPDDAILYLNILAGGFSTIAPTKEIADRVTGFQFYVTTEEEESERESSDKYGSKMEAYSELMDLLMESGNDALVYISYLLTDLTKGYTRNTSRSIIKKDFINFIENGDNGSNKKKSIDKFYKLALAWRNDRESVIGKAIISAGIYYGKIKRTKEKKYEYKNILLGTTPESAYEILMKPVNQSDFDDLSQEIEDILNR